jgi:hypothetical protein
MEFVKLLDVAYSVQTAIKLIVDNYSAHFQRDQSVRAPCCATSGLASKQELKHRLMAAVDYFSGDPVVHTWTYKLDKAA